MLNIFGWLFFKHFLGYLLLFINFYSTLDKLITYSGWFDIDDTLNDQNSPEEDDLGKHYYNFASKQYEREKKMDRF